MPTYVVLGRLTAHAKGNLAEARKKRDEVWEAFRKQGVKISSYMTMGQYDVVNIVEAPTDELAMKFLIASGATGNVETTTMRAFTQTEADALMGR